MGGLAIGELGKRSIREFLADDMPTYAAGLAYQILFALLPFVIFLLALLSFLEIPRFFDFTLLLSAMLILAAGLMLLGRRVAGWARRIRRGWGIPSSPCGPGYRSRPRSYR